MRLCNPVAFTEPVKDILANVTAGDQVGAWACLVAGGVRVRKGNGRVPCDFVIDEGTHSAAPDECCTVGLGHVALQLPIPGFSGGIVVLVLGLAELPIPALASRNVQ